MGCKCQSQRESAPGLLLKVTHLVNNAAAVGGGAVRFDRWLCIPGSSAAEQMGSGAKQPYQTHREPLRNMRTLSSIRQSSLNPGALDPFHMLTPAYLVTAASHMACMGATASLEGLGALTLPFKEPDLRWSPNREG